MHIVSDERLLKATVLCRVLGISAGKRPTYRQQSIISSVSSFLLVSGSLLKENVPNSDRKKLFLCGLGVSDEGFEGSEIGDRFTPRDPGDTLVVILGNPVVLMEIGGALEP